MLAYCVSSNAPKERLEAAGYVVLELELRGKGLERLAKRRRVPENTIYEEYDKLERKTKCSADYKRGRDQTEALVTMKATPNNTLPIFWWEGKIKWRAPFPRPLR